MEGSGQTAPPAQPTPQDAQAIFERATAAAQRAETAAQRLEAAQQAAGSETRDRFPGMPEGMVDQITQATAKLVVEALDAKYELAGQNPPPPSGASPAAGAGSAPVPPAGDASGDGTPPGDEPPPGHRNLAHRILGY